MKSHSKSNSIKVCGVTTSRADFGILKSLFRKLEDDKRFQFQLAIGGSHLEDRFSAGLQEVLQEGFSDVHTIGHERKESAADPSDVIGATIPAFAAYLRAQTPSVVVCLGDRYELLGFALPTFFSPARLVHLHGGEKTIGSFDDSIRHAITKLSDVHLTAHSSYAKRVAQLGEDQSRIFIVGAMGAAPITQSEMWSIPTLEKKLGASLLERNIFVTFHSETRSPDGGLEVLSDLLAALPVEEGTRIVFSDTNGDPHNQELYELIDEFIVRANGLAICVKSLGREGYHACLQYFDAIVGNSSSGILEAASYGTPVVNVGIRQQGRYMPGNIIDVTAGRDEIRAAIQLALSDRFKKSTASASNPYQLENQEALVAQLIYENFAVPKLKNFSDL